MGLLEKAQQKKVQSSVEEESPVIKTKKRQPSTQQKTAKQEQENGPKAPYRIITSENTAEQPRSLLEKARQRKISPPQPPKNIPWDATQKKEETFTGLILENGEKKIEVIEEQTGFGWKKQGARRTVYDHTTHEYIYEVIEPQLNEDEKQVKNEISHLFKMLADINTFDMTNEEKEKFLEETIERIISDNHIYFEEGSKDTIFYHIFRDFLGYGRIDILMHDDGIEDISCDGPTTPIFIYHRKHEGIETNIYFDSEQELNSFLVRLCQISGKQISIFSPIVDGKLPDGSRLQATLARTVTKGSTFTIRKFKEIPLTPIDLIEYKSLSTEMAAYFWMAIEDGASILFCGGTASGKTTALNALMLFIPASHKIISIEDTREVNIPHKNWIAGTTRKGFATSDDNKTGKDIDMFDLIRAALRQRPRVIIVGEVRGREADSLFQAMATGHTAYATVHASTIHMLIQRLENPPIELPRALLTSLDIIVFQNAVDIGGKMVRRMTSVTEIIKLDTDTNQLIFMAPYTWVSKTDDRFESSGSSKILNRIKQQNDWTDEQLLQELNNRILVLEWMRKNKVRSYKKFGSLIAEYKKFPEKILALAKKDMEE
ncbi:MAG TPA: secretion system protein E [Thermoplasmata archaeon]|jgi:archaeal flagellar protein FlaI|nr:MAG TPA: secretion system protein E [Thermoplasmata archaeon]